MFREQHPIRASRQLSPGFQTIIGLLELEADPSGAILHTKQGELDLDSTFPRHTPSFGDSPSRETIAQPAKDRHPIQARQWLAVGDPWWLFTQFVQFFGYRWFPYIGYRWFPDNWRDSTLRTLWRHSLPLSRHATVVHCLFIRYARLIFSDSLNSLPV